MRALPRLHLVTDDETLARDDFLDLARAALEAGGDRVALHVRGPGTSGRRLHLIAGALKEAAASAGALLAVNDRVDVALALSISAVQLGARSLPVEAARRLLGRGVLVGRSVHGEDEASEAVAAGADFLVLGTIWSTPTHPDRDGAGLELVRRVVGRVAPTPVVAIGGVTPERLSRVVRADGHGAAVLRGVWRAGDPSRAVTRYLQALALNPNAP